MKKITQTTSSLLVLLLVHLSSFSQNEVPDDRLTKKTVFKAYVSGDKKREVSGYLLNSNDSVVFLSAKPQPFKSILVNDSGVQKVAYTDIDVITVKRRGSAGTGAVFGLVLGASLGVLTGLTAGNNNKGQMISGEVLAGVLGIFGGATGAVIGAIAGALVEKRFFINRKKENLQNMNSTLLERLY